MDLVMFSMTRRSVCIFVVRVLFAFIHRYSEPARQFEQTISATTCLALEGIGTLWNATYATRYCFCMSSGCFFLLCFCVGRCGQSSLPYILLRVLVFIVRIQLCECCV